MNQKIYIWSIIVLSFVGFLDALYLFINWIYSSPINCLIFEGCETVNNSPYAQIFGIPLSFFGVVFYLAIFLMAIRYLQLAYGAEKRGIEDARNDTEENPLSPPFKGGYRGFVPFKGDLFIKIIFYISVAGLLFAAYSLTLQIFVIDALCVYCIVSVIVSVLIFIVSCIIYGRRLK